MRDLHKGRTKNKNKRFYKHKPVRVENERFLSALQNVNHSLLKYYIFLIRQSTRLVSDFVSSKESIFFCVFQLKFQEEKQT